MDGGKTGGSDGRAGPVVQSVVWRTTDNRAAYQMLARLIFDPILMNEFEKEQRRGST